MTLDFESIRYQLLFRIDGVYVIKNICIFEWPVLNPIEILDDFTPLMFVVIYSANGRVFVEGEVRFNVYNEISEQVRLRARPRWRWASDEIFGDECPLKRALISNVRSSS